MKNKNMRKISITIKPQIFPTEPYKTIGKCYKTNNDKFYFYQRENDVLLVNSKSPLISSNCVGYMKNQSNIIECSIQEFTDVLNTTIFNMNILNGEFKK
jgi:hypothetical protein